MKGHKTLLLSANVILFILIFINESFSQMIGSTGDQSPSPKEVKSASLNSDVFRGDVSLTTGTLNLTQNLGKVATPSGLCFSLDLNYSSTSQGGDNIPVIKGVPYGEGWDLSIPIITVSTKFYTKLDEATKNFINTQIIAFPDVVPSYYTQDDILKENQPYWFSPHISIPGIINERFVFKYFEKSTNTMVFMPAKFERFIEARLDNGVWTVSLWDGTDYYFNVVQTNSVSPSNQRMLHDSNGDLINNADEACTKPTDEVVSIYCSKIRNLNHPAGQAIVFKYNKYGKFNFLKEFHDETNQYPVDLSVYKEIYLKEVAAIDKETVLEEIFLDYSTVLDASTVMTGNPNDEIVTIEHNFLINATGAQDLLTIRQPGVERLDSLYNFKSIYKHGNFGGGNTINFEDGWKRYVHMKHPWVNCGTNFTYLNSSFNPYVGDYFGTCDLMFTYPAQFDPINNSLNSLTSSLSFNHSFLESPRLTSAVLGESMPAGDIYEIRTKEYDNGQSQATGLARSMNFDINISSGPTPTGGVGCNSIGSLVCEGQNYVGSVRLNDFNQLNKDQAFSTFGNGLKWNFSTPHYNNDNSVQTSNFFVMPKFPVSYTGISIQIGPANSDNLFDAHGSGVCNFSDLLGNNFLTNLNLPSAMWTYYNNLEYTYPNNPNYNKLRSEATMPQNFGIGLPWHMMSEFYAFKGSFCLGCNSANTTIEQYAFWWNQFSGSNPNLYPNKPTLADEDVQLVNVELIRYCKNPYMLTGATYYKAGGNFTSMEDPFLNENYEGNTPYIQGLSAIKSYKFAYGTKSLALMDNVNTPSNPPAISGNTIVFVLKKVIQVPVSSLSPNSQLILSECPTVEFFYNKTFPDNNNYSTFSPIINLPGALATNTGMVAINKVINELGGETEYVYYPNLIGCISYKAHRNVGAPIPDPDERKIPEVSLSLSAIVNQKIIHDKSNSTKTWDYEFDPLNLEWQSNIGYFTDALSRGPSNGNLLSGGKINTTFCFKEVKVIEPPVGTLNERPYTKYFNYYLNPRHFGKLEKEEKYNASDAILSKTEYVYKDELIYDEPTPVSSAGPNNLVIYENCDFSTPLAFQLHDYITDNLNLTCAKSIYYGEFEFRDLIGANSQKIYFVPIASETKTFYGQNLTNTSTASGPIENDATGIAYRSGSMLTSVDYQDLINSELNLTQIEVSTITEYEYYDAKFTVDGNNFLCKTTSEGLRRIIPGFTGSDYSLAYEPSFEIASKKTYSPQMPGEYKQEEYYYYYDLWNYFTDLDAATDNFSALNYSMIYGIRNLEYEHRVVTKSTGFNPVSKSKYYLYEPWEVPYYDSPDQEVFIQSGPGGGPDPDPCWNLELGRMYTGSIIKNLGHEIELNTAYKENGHDFGNPCDDSYQFRLHLFYYPDDTNFVFLNRDLSWASCPSLPYTINENASLLLKSVIEQVADDNLTSEYIGLASSKKTSTNILRFDIDASNSNGVINVFPFKKLETCSIINVNRWGQQKRTSDEKGLITYINYSPVSRIFYKDQNDPTNILYYQVLRQLIGVPVSETIGEGTTEPLTTSYTYYNNYSINTITDPNNLLTHFTYDIFGRLFEKFINNHKISTNYYSIWNRDAAYNFEERSTMNFVETKSFNNFLGNEGQVTREYIDPLGKQFNNLSFANSNILSNQLPSEIVYSGEIVKDKWGRTIKQFRPFKLNIFNAIEPKLNQELPSLVPQEYSTIEYENDQRSRILKSAPVGEDITLGHFKNSQYGYVRGNRLSYELGLNEYVHELVFPTVCEEGVSYIAENFTFEKEINMDEDGKVSISYNDMSGRKVALLQFIDPTHTATTIFLYDKFGNSKKVINPEFQETNYYYNLRGNLYKKETVDGGSTIYIYDKSGNIVLEQDQVNADNSFARVNTYDSFGRKVKQERVSLTENLQNISDVESNNWCFNRSGITYNNLISSPNKKIEKEWFYGTAIDLTNPIYYFRMKSYLQNSRYGMIGRLSHTRSYDNDSKLIQNIFYSYNLHGLLKWELHQFNSNGLNASSKGITTRIDYKDYNLKGQLLNKVVDVNCDHKVDFGYNFLYDEWNRLKELYAGFSNEQASNYKIVSYQYDQTDSKLTNTIYHDLDGIHLADNIENNYDIRNRLLSINSHLFDWNMYYDYNTLSVNQPPIGLACNQNYNGNINATYGEYNLGTANGVTNPPPGNLFEIGSFYCHIYDGMNRLTEASWKGIEHPGTIISTGINSEDYNYDRAGNLLSLNRTMGDISLNPENFDYNYTLGTNKLENVFASPNYPDRSYSYDANGNLTSDMYRNMSSVVYGRANLPNELVITNPVTQQGTLVKYLYDINDSRIYKYTPDLEHIDGIPEYYLKDANGVNIGILNMSDQNTWTFYVSGHTLSAKIKPLGIQQPQQSMDDIGDWEDVDNTELRTSQITDALQEIENMNLEYPDTLLEIDLSGGLKQFILRSVLNELPPFTYTLINSQPISGGDQLIRVRKKDSPDDLLITVDELIAQTNILTLDPNIANNLLDPFYIPYIYQTDQVVYQIYYYIYDHLGNTRIVYSPTFNSNPAINAENYALEGVFDYYPYGKILREYISGTQEKFLTTHHERDLETGLDYRGARFYDADVARFLSLDPLATQYANISPYNYVAANPIFLIDPSGMGPELISSESETSYVGISDGSAKNGKSREQEDKEKDKEKEKEKEKEDKKKEAQGGGGSWIDNLQTGLDVAGIADPTGIVDGVNALIYAGRGQLKNAGISALAIIPYFGDVGKAGRLGAKTLQLTSKARTAERGLEIGQRFLGTGYREIAPGVFRSSDNLRQFRMTDADILPKHGNIGPHFNFEILDASGNFLRNYHMPIR